jgi:predicted DCC family thiol-disulfide oxidoreductase YuxK
MAQLTVLYDGQCGLCRASVARAQRFNGKQTIEFLDLHAPDAASRFPHVDRAQAMKAMTAVDSSGRTYSGVDAWAYVAALLPGWRALAPVVRLPGIHFLSARIYAWVARNRYRWNRDACSGSSCSLHANASQPNTPRSNAR